MDALLLTGAAVAFLMGIVHSILGERYILIRLLRRENLPNLFGSDVFTKRTIRLAWHVTSIAWWGFGGLLVVLARDGDVSASAIRGVIAATFAVSGALVLVGSRGRHLAWVAMFLVALAAWVPFR